MALWQSEELETCEFCAQSVAQCLCVPPLMQRANCDALFKLVFYSPHRSTPVQNRVIYQMKRSNDVKTASFVAARLAPGVLHWTEENGLDPKDVILTYLPRGHRARLLYGTDQARQLALALSQQCGFSMQRLIVRRPGADRKQKQLNAEQRVRNAKRSFRAAKHVSCRGKTVLLADDIVTTGAGMAVCSGLLYRMGAERVCGIVVAMDEETQQVR